MLRPLTIATALALCSLSGPSSAYAQGVLRTIEKNSAARGLFQTNKLYSIENWKLVPATPIRVPLPWGEFKVTEFDLKPLWWLSGAAYICHQFKSCRDSEL
jgi:hypothetical protein